MNKIKNPILVLGISTISALVSSVATAHDSWQSSRADSHAPIGVMGDHTHNKDEVMVSYRYMAMAMEGLRDGTDRVDGTTMVTPEQHDMDMHMVGIMYAPNDTVTLMTMFNYLENKMDLKQTMTMMGNTMTTQFDTESSGMGDTKVGALINVWKSEQDNHRIHLNTNISIPTGDIGQKDDTPMADNMQLGYRMQLGSGTWDIQAGATYLGQTDTLSWGAQGLVTVRTDKNHHGYNLGNRYELTGWAAKPVTPWLSLSLRLQGIEWDNIDGSDDDISPMMETMNPVMNPDQLGGQRVDGLVGINLLGTNDSLKGHRLAFEYGIPLHQDLDGPQLETDSNLIIGWQKAF